MTMAKSLCLLLVFSVGLYAQEGKLRGKVTDKETGEPLIGANVAMEGTTLGASTDLNGEYVILSVPPGTYSVKTSYIGYASMTVANIRVGSNLTTTQDFALSSTAISVEAVEVIAERPLIQRNTTNTVRVTTQENLEALPIRGVQNIIALEAGVVQQDGNLHIRGGRTGEVAFFVDGSNITNPFTNGQNINVIQEGLEEMQVQTGGYTAEFGGANSGLVRTTLRTGGSDYKFSLDAQTDDFAGPGREFLGTTSRGYRNIVGTASGPLVLNNLRFFLAGQHNFARNQQPIFIDPFRFDNMVTDALGARPAGQPLPGPIEFKRNYLYNNWRQDNQLQGTLLYNLNQFKIKFSGSAEETKTMNGGGWPNALPLYFDQSKNTITKNTLMWGNLRFTHVVNPTTFYEIGVSYQRSRFSTYDQDFKSKWWLYSDSVANAQLGYTDFVSRYQGPNPYSTIYGFAFAAPGAPNNGYNTNLQSGVNGTVDFTSQINSNWELKAGGSLDAWTIRTWGIANIKNLLEYMDTNRDGVWDRSFTSALERRVFMIRQGGINAIGYQYDNPGKQVDSGPDGPAKPFTASAYIQNKFEYKDLIVNVGVRYELFDPKATAVPTTLNPTTGLYDYQNPPFDENLNVLKENELTKTDPYSYLLPRVSFSFPVTDNTVFYALYGKYAQMPALNNVYLNNIVLSGLFDPLARVPYNLGGATVGFMAKPERLTQYEIGIRQSLSENFAMTLTGFYKDTKDQLSIRRVFNSAGVPLTTAFENEDFGTIKGVELTLELRRTSRLAARANYTLSDARGTGSAPRSSQQAVTDEASARFPEFISPLTFNQTHKGSIMLDYRFARGDGGPVFEGMGLNLLLSFNSGHNYTKVEEPHNLGQASPWTIGVRALQDSRSRVPVEPINSSTTPWVFNVDMTFNKVFFLDYFNVEVYARVLNVFNTKSILNVFPSTGTPYDDGWLKNSLATQYLQIPGYEQFYRAVNLDNRWAYARVNGVAGGGLGQQAGNDLFGAPREIRLGVKLEY